MKTSSGATAVHVVWSYQRGSRKIEHVGSAHDKDELEALKAAARQKLAAGQMELGLGRGAPGLSGPCSEQFRHTGNDEICRCIGQPVEATALIRVADGLNSRAVSSDDV